jgi:hypothetical protein
MHLAKIDTYDDISKDLLIKADDVRSLILTRSIQ